MYLGQGTTTNSGVVGLDNLWLIDYPCAHDNPGSYILLDGQNFETNKSGFSASITREGGFGRPSDIAFGPDGAMYIVDMGTNTIEEPNVFIPNTGVIWKITRI